MDQIFCQCARGNAAKASTSGLASAMSAATLGNRAPSWAATLSQAASTASGSGCAKIVRNTAAAMCWWLRGTSARRLSVNRPSLWWSSGTG